MLLDTSEENQLILVMIEFYHPICKIKGKLYKFIFLKCISDVNAIKMLNLWAKIICFLQG